MTHSNVKLNHSVFSVKEFLVGNNLVSNEFQLRKTGDNYVVWAWSKDKDTSKVEGWNALFESTTIRKAKSYLVSLITVLGDASKTF